MTKLRKRARPRLPKAASQSSMIVNDEDVSAWFRMSGRYYCLALVCCCVIIFMVAAAAAGMIRHQQRLSPSANHRSPFHQYSNITCSSSSSSSSFVEGCTPIQCARFVIDDFASVNQVDQLIELANMGMDQAGGDGAPSILDLHSGAVSFKSGFIDMYKRRQHLGLPEIPRTLLQNYISICDRVKHMLQLQFGATSMWLTTPGFFSRINASKPIRTEHDVYYRSHVDTLQYSGFVYTALLYLNNFNVDFEGGRFLFEDDADEALLSVVEPKAGRLLVFTSGHENVHRVEKVTSGVRYALTIAFTCDQDKAAPVLRGLK